MPCRPQVDGTTGAGVGVGATPALSRFGTGTATSNLHLEKLFSYYFGNSTIS